MRTPSSGGVAVLVGADGRARYDGLQTCGSVWLCPICGRRISEYRRREVNQVLTWARAAGHDVRMVTLTLRHYDGQPLPVLFEQLREGKRRWRQLAAVRRIWKGAVIGSITAVEVTHGVNGWHPHIHMVVICRAGTGDELWRLAPDWLSALRSQGGDGNDHAFDVGDAQAVGDYITKWGPGEELTSDSLKTGSGRSPWRLLADADAGSVEAGYLWCRYADAMKGKRQLVWSPGLRAAAGLDVELDDQAVAVLDDGDVDNLPVQGPVQEIGIIPRRLWYWLCTAQLRAWLLDGIEAGRGLDELLAIVEDTGGGVRMAPIVEEVYKPLHTCAEPARVRYDAGHVHRKLVCP